MNQWKIFLFYASSLRKAGFSLRLRELWEYRELLYFLTWRDIKVRYKQTALGAAWAIIQPLFTMLVFSLFFRTAGQSSIGRHSLSHLLLHGAGSLDILCQWSDAILEQSGRQFESHHQSLLSAPDHSAGHGALRHY